MLVVVVLVAAYVLIATKRIHRVAAALGGAAGMVLLGGHCCIERSRECLAVNFRPGGAQDRRGVSFVSTSAALMAEPPDLIYVHATTAGVRRLAAQRSEWLTATSRIWQRVTSGMVVCADFSQRIVEGDCTSCTAR